MDDPRHDAPRDRGVDTVLGRHFVSQDLVSIVIPTLNRPLPLERALTSALAQVVPDDVAIEIIVVDNSAAGTARAIVSAISAATSRQVRFVHEPNPGVANARNAGTHAARGRWVAFLDDDEEAAADWISGLVAVARLSGADAVFGPVVAKAEGIEAIGPFSPYFSRAIARANGSDITDLAAYLGTNNSMFDRLRCLDAVEPFARGLNETGGEDSLLLQRLVRARRRFAWAASAPVTEWVPARRLNWHYVWKVKFSSGQIRVFVQQMLPPVRWHAIALWMAIGAVQAAVGGVAALLLAPFEQDRAGRALATAYGGLGKILWLAPFRQKLYGTRHVS